MLTKFIKEEFVEMVEETAFFISENSVQNAKVFTKGINPTINEIAKNPFGYPKLFIFQSGDYRFCKYMKSWKIIFKITKTHLISLGIIHSARHNNEILKLK